MRRSAPLLFFCAALLATGCHGVAKLDFTSLGRDMWQRPDDVVRLLAIAPEHTVADVGAGQGYFVEHLAVAASAGRVSFVNTFHHIEDRPAYFRRLQRDLAPGGRVAIIEPNEELGGVLSLFITSGHASRAEAVEAQMREAGYELTASHAILPVQIFHVYAPLAGTGF